MERRLVEIWERELGISPIGVTDDFFDLGVTSIVAATLFAAIEHELGDTLPLGAIFRAPTIEALAQLLETRRGELAVDLADPDSARGLEAADLLHPRRGGHDPAPRRRWPAGSAPTSPSTVCSRAASTAASTPLKTVEEMATHYLVRDAPGHGRRARGTWPDTASARSSPSSSPSGCAPGARTSGCVAMFNGPSPSWIAALGWYGTSPPTGASTAPPTAARAPSFAAGGSSAGSRAWAGVRDPRRLITGLKWELRAPMTRARSPSAGRSPSACARSSSSSLHSRAERALRARALSRRSPGLLRRRTSTRTRARVGAAWRRGGIRTSACPGEHDNNRQAMMEPAVGFVADRLQEYLEGAA